MERLNKRFFAVPSPDVNLNKWITDVIGNTEDNPFITEDDVPGLIRYAKAAYLHAHGKPFCFPELPEFFVLATSDAAAGVHGAKVQIIAPEDTEGDFDIHWLEIHDISAVGEYEVALWSGPETGEKKIWCTKYGRSTAQARAGSKAVLVRQLPKGTRISISIACSATGGKTTEFSVDGHYYL